MKIILVLLVSVAALGQSRPNHKLTPGLIRSTNAKELCSPSFRTKPFRKTTQSTKKLVCRNYRIRVQCPGPAQEIDHLVPLELGGADDIHNLWPQPYAVPGAHQKDLVENELKRRVCGGQMSLAEAQSMLMHDWYSAYVKLGFGGVRPK
jgi:hypothetical protein